MNITWEQNKSYEAETPKEQNKRQLLQEEKKRTHEQHTQATKLTSSHLLLTTLSTHL